MKTSLFLLFGLLIIGMGCREPSGGGMGYQYLGTLDAITRTCDIDGVYTSTIKVNNERFTVVGHLDVKRICGTYVWVNAITNTLRIRRHEITSEHYILSSESRNWRKN